ncbi:MAG TPA: hypothetical protein VE779_09995 [Candidatus Angelobacter sp.]|nr:hypothetical protein [Candidatus Angelobacter sp.]
MPRSAFACSLLAIALLEMAAAASPLPFPASDDQSSGTAAKKQADNPKKPTQAKDPKATEKVKTDDRMSTRGLKPPPKTAEKDKPAKPPSSTDSTNPK